jgi:hypothetical protein
LIDGGKFSLCSCLGSWWSKGWRRERETDRQTDRQIGFLKWFSWWSKYQGSTCHLGYTLPLPPIPHSGLKPLERACLSGVDKHHLGGLGFAEALQRKERLAKPHTVECEAMPGCQAHTGL